MKLPLKVRQVGGGGHAANQVFVCDADKRHVATIHSGKDVQVTRGMKHDAITEAKKANASAIVEAFDIILGLASDPCEITDLVARATNLKEKITHEDKVPKLQT